MEKKPGAKEHSPFPAGSRQAILLLPSGGARENPHGHLRNAQTKRVSMRGRLLWRDETQGWELITNECEKNGWGGRGAELEGQITPAGKMNEPMARDE